MTMTLLFDSARDEVPAEVTAAGGVIRAVRAVNRWFARLRAQRARRLALATLMDMDANRLDDLGITLQDVREALSR